MPHIPGTLEIALKGNAPELSLDLFPTPWHINALMISL